MLVLLSKGMINFAFASHDEFTCNKNYIALDIFKYVNAFNKKNICDPSNTKMPTKIPFTRIEGV